MEKPRKEAEDLSGLFAEIYFLCHPAYTVRLSHQGVRVLHFVAMSSKGGRSATVGNIAAHLGLAHNSASELLKRLREKGLVAVRRGERDERVVEAELTEEGERALREHVGLDVGRLGEALSAMGQEEREAVLSAFGLLARRLRAGTPSGRRRSGPTVGLIGT